jgi:hypothetical protein
MLSVHVLPYTPYVATSTALMALTRGAHVAAPIVMPAVKHVRA